MEEYCKEWAKKLCKDAKPEDQASSSIPISLELESIVNFLHTLPVGGPTRVVVKKFAQTQAMYVLNTILHVHTQLLKKRDELNAILLATHFGLVDKVRIHNFHLYCHIKAEQVHVPITQSYWDSVKILLHYISGKPRVKIAFDELLCPAIAAWKNHKPYAQIVCDIPKSLTNIITTCIHIPQKHPSLWAFTRGYYSD